MQVVPIIAADHACRLAGFALEKAIREPAALADVLLSARDRYGHDMIVVWCDMLLEAEALGARIEFIPGEFPVLLEPVAPGLVDWTFDEGRGRIGVMLDAVRSVRNARPPGEPVAASLKGPFSLAALLTGAEAFLGSLMLDPSSARKAVEGACRFQAGFAGALAEAGGVPWFGDPLASGDLLGGRWFEDFALDALREVVRSSRDAAGRAAVHVCGDPDPLLGLLPRLEADWLSLELSNPSRIKDRLGNTLLFGGVPTVFLMEQDADTVFEFARKRASDLPPGCVLATDCDVPEHTPPENVAAMVRGAREGFRSGGMG